LALKGGGTPVCGGDLSARVTTLTISCFSSHLALYSPNHHSREKLASVARMKTVVSINDFDDLAMSFATSVGVEADDHMHYIQEVLSPLGSSKSANQLCQCADDEDHNGGDLKY